MTLDDAFELVEFVAGSLRNMGRISESKYEAITQDEKEEIALEIVKRHISDE